MPQLFGAKLRHLREQRELSQSEHARRVGLARHTHINHIEAGRRAPSLELVLHLAGVLGVTTDYLLRDSIPVASLVAQSPPRQFGTPIQLFSAKLYQLRTQRALTQQDLTHQLGLASQGYISKLESGTKQPSPDLVAEIAEFFGVTTEYLLRDDLPVDLSTSVVSAG